LGAAFGRQNAGQGGAASQLQDALARQCLSALPQEVG